MISVLILAGNEEANLPACLESVAWSDDIVVFDSLSTDRTVEIARAAGARVIQRRWDNERDQRMASLQVPFKYPWVYNPDADEVTPPDLRDEMLRIVADPARTEVAYRLRFKTMFMGRWIRRSSLYPTWVVRLFRPQSIRLTRDINVRYTADGPEGKLLSHFEHYTFRKGLRAWLEKHNIYSDLEAKEAIKVLSRQTNWRDLLSLNQVRRRAAWKDMSFRIPFRSVLVYLYLMFVRGALFDGPAGWTYCGLRAYYEFMIAAKVEELRLRERGRSL